MLLSCFSRTFLCAALVVSGAGMISAQEPYMISAFFGLDNELNGQQAFLATSPQANPWNVDNPMRPNPMGLNAQQFNGLDGLPVVFSELLDPTTLDPADFLITTASGATYMPFGATVNPAHDAGERRTVALFGDFGDADRDPPLFVSLVGELLSVDGVDISLTASPVDVISLDDGPKLVFAENVAPASVESIEGSKMVLRAVWAGGIRAADGNEVTEQEWSQYVLTGTDAFGNTIYLTPVAIGDLDDNDNNHLLYFDQAITPARLSLPGGLHIDPNGDFNPDTSVAVAVMLGDFNNDGVVDELDVGGFFLALRFPRVFGHQFPNINPAVIFDFNGDGRFNRLDVPGFLSELLN